MRILIAEDDTGSRMILEAALVRLGHEVTTAPDGEAAWQSFQTSEFDAVVSDRSMPRIDGIELCRRVRAQASQHYVYFIFLTSAKDKDRIAEGMEAGADDYLVKPVDLDELSARLVVARRITELYHRLEQQQRELQVLNRRLFDLARSDPLTQLGTRLKLREDLDLIASRASEAGASYCAIMCDVDRFKPYNDTYGHLAGDEVLRTVAATIKNELRHGAEAYRYGGEEFLLIVPSTSLQGGQFSAERHRAAVEALKIPHQATPQKIITISCGVAFFRPRSATSVHAWLEDADGALYRAKELGRNRVVISNKDPAVQAC